MDTRIDNLEECMVISLNGRFDADVSLRLGERVDFEIEGRMGGGPIDFDVIVDMGDVPYISSGAIRVLLSLHKRLAAAGHRLAVCDLQPLVAKVIDISGLFGLFNIYPSVEDARENLAG
jgi:anti-anti-sigma factor